MQKQSWFQKTKNEKNDIETDLRMFLSRQLQIACDGFTTATTTQITDT